MIDANSSERLSQESVWWFSLRQQVMLFGWTKRELASGSWGFRWCGCHIWIFRGAQHTFYYIFAQLFYNNSIHTSKLAIKSSKFQAAEDDNNERVGQRSNLGIQYLSIVGVQDRLVRDVLNTFNLWSGLKVATRFDVWGSCLPSTCIGADIYTILRFC